MKPKLLLTLSILILLFASLACQSAGPLSGLFATETPTATMTPSPTVTPSPTLTPTMTPTLTPVPSGVVQEKLANGDTRVTDYDTGLTLVISKDWLVIPANLDDLSSMSSQLKQTNPEIADALSAMKNMDPDTLRLLAFNSNPAHNEKGFVTNLNIVRIENAIIAAMPLQMILDANADQLKSSIPGAKVLSSEVSKNGNGVEVGVLELELPIKAPSGTVSVYEKLVLIQNDKGISMLTFATPKSLLKTLGPVFDSIIATIARLDS